MSTRIAFLAVILLAAPLFAADAPAPTTQPADVLAQPLNPKLLEMGDNTWQKLSPAGMAMARMYSGCCWGAGYVWYFGGAHRGYKGNDVQLYNPRVGQWVQATAAEWPEVGSPDWKSMTNGGGSTQNLSPTGAPFTEHTYQQVCWQPDRKRFFVVLVSSGTWEFDPATFKWTHLINKFKKERPEPRGHWAHNQVVWEPTLKAPVLLVSSGGGDVYKFDHGKREWQKAAALPGVLNWQEFYLTWVPEWKAFCISGGKGFYRYDVPAAKAEPIEAPAGLKGCQSLAYDSANHVVIAMARRGVSKGVNTVVPWALDVKTMKWTELAPPEPWPQGQSAGAWAKLWYDPDHNVFLFVNDVRRDRRELFDGGVTETWAYRYRKAAPARSADPAAAATE